MTRRLVLLAALSGLTLQGCWVPQVVQGVRPEIFPSTLPENPLLARLSLESKQVALATSAIKTSRVMAEMFYLSGSLASHRQSLENHLYYNVQSLDSFSGWQFIKSEGNYTYYNTSDGSRFSLLFMDTTGNQFEDFDLMGFSSYGPEPQPAQAFPKQIKSYQLGMKRFNFQDNAHLGITLKGSWPEQVPLRGSFQTTLNGSGSLPDHPYLENLSLKLDGTASSDHAQIDGQLSFSTNIEGKIYNGFGRFDAIGFVDSVFIEHNGLNILTIQRQDDDSWNIIRDQKVVASTH